MEIKFNDIMQKLSILITAANLQSEIMPSPQVGHMVMKEQCTLGLTCITYNNYNKRR